MPGSVLMGCGGAKRAAPNQIVQIGVVKKPKRSRELPKVGDFHCGECGLTLHKRVDGYYHKCPGPRSIAYQEARRKKCETCDHNLDGMCVETKKLHPDRDALIEIGVRMAFAACPIGEWGKTQISCPNCDSPLFDASGVTACRYCGWREVKRLRYTLNIDKNVIDFLRESGNDTAAIESVFQNSEAFKEWKSKR